MVDCHIEIGDGLCLYSLCGINDKQSAFTSSNRAAHFIREVNMSRSINKIEQISLTISLIFHLNGMALDGNTSFSLQIHIIKHLTFCNLDSISFLQ